MLILAIDTSTSAIGVGLSDGESVLGAAHRIEARGHTEHLAPLVAALLRDVGTGVGDLTGLVVGTGPGPFTGLRVGMVTGLTMGHALGVRVHGMCSLDVLAHQALCLECGPGRSDHRLRTRGEVLVATDARRREVYWARYLPGTGPGAHDGVVRVGDPAVDRPAELPPGVRSLPTAGRGPVLYPDLFPNPLDPLDVDAGLLALLGARRVASAEPMPVEPLYLRRPDALTTAERATP
ncbi:tRNA (adenosine(37)-N6)-threonylcarbamoyltransferase complex dimerization subunit type 1 TsaB [Fodinibacter luteus]|uniref:tRNA (Adenosine(37)-N6)-threonylcarbamoyltransferase complex dimerization subunit type 1 TsaB n=1 Tax=Fodinibacter luteus TaxID=552064 RepID=A0ABP8JUZ4_9MICO